MVRLSGIAAVLLIAGVPCLVLPERHVLGAGVVAAAICAGGLLLPSLGLAIAGAVLAVLVFSVALLVASAANAVMAAMLMGITVLVLLDASHFHQRFSRSAIMPGVVRAHLGQLGATILVSVLAVGCWPRCRTRSGSASTRRCGRRWPRQAASLWFWRSSGPPPAECPPQKSAGHPKPNLRQHLSPRNG